MNSFFTVGIFIFLDVFYIAPTVYRLYCVTRKKQNFIKRNYINNNTQCHAFLTTKTSCTRQWKCCYHQGLYNGRGSKTSRSRKWCYHQGYYIQYITGGRSLNLCAVIKGELIWETLIMVDVWLSVNFFIHLCPPTTLHTCQIKEKRHTTVFIFRQFWGRNKAPFIKAKKSFFSWLFNEIHKCKL